MSIKMNPDYKTELVQRIKDAGQEIIDRAEEIAVGEFKTDLDISIHFDMGMDCADEISWSTSVINKTRYKRLFD